MRSAAAAYLAGATIFGDLLGCEHDEHQPRGAGDRDHSSDCRWHPRDRFLVGIQVSSRLFGHRRITLAMQNSFNHQMVMKAAADKAGMTDRRGTLGEQGPDARNDLMHW